MGFILHNYNEYNNESSSLLELRIKIMEDENIDNQNFKNYLKNIINSRLIK